MFRNFLKSSNGTFWVCKYFIMFTNSFGNFLNVQEHFKKLLWNILKYFPTNFLMNIFNSSQNFFQKISEFVLKYFFTRHFDLKCLQTCSGTFWLFKNILKSSNGTFWKFPNKFHKKVLEQSTKQIRMFRNTFWKLVNVSKQIWMSGTLWIVSKALKVFRNTLEIWMFLNKSKCFGTKMNVSEHSQKSECSQTLFWNHLNVPK